MRVTIQMPDELYELYVARAEKVGARPTSYIAEFFHTFQDVDMADRILIIHKTQRVRLEALFGAQIAGADDLVRKVERILSLQIEAVEIDFTPGQKSEINRIAARNNISYKEQVKRTVKSMESMFFSHLPGSF